MRLARAVSLAPWSLAAGVIAYLAARVTGAAAPLQAALGLGAPVLCAALGVALWGFLRPLTPSRIARLVDERTGQQDRFSTAVEVDASSSLLAAALHRDAARRSAHIRDHDVVAFRVPRLATAALAATVGIAVAAQALAPLAGSAMLATAPEDAITVERVRELAELAAQVAEARQDPHLAAVAKALAELAEEASARNAVEPDAANLGELVRALDRLLAPRGSLTASTARASANRSDAPLGESLSSVEERLERMLALALPGERGDYDDPETTWLEGDRVRQGPILGDAPDLNLSSNAAGSQAAEGLENAAVQASDEPPGDLTSAFIIGASSDSTRGDSSMAGQGTEELFGEEGTTAEAVAAETLGVQGTETEDGRRVSVEVAPDAAEQGAATGTYVVAAWLPTGLPQVATQSLPFKYRSVAGNYFLPPQQTASR